MLAKALITLTLLVSSALVRADADLQAFLERTLAAARDQHRLPAVAALVQIDGGIAAEAALGVRALGRANAVTPRDRWHLGSDTKAITATLIVRLAEQGVLRLDDTLAAAWPGIAADMHPDHRNTTLKQLLSHTAGLPPLTDDNELPPFLAAIRSARGVQAQRSAIARHYLAQAPASKAGEFAYSNVGYIVAGAVAEARTGKRWEDLVRSLIFAPLGITQAGFGAPGRSGAFDQPRGHRELAGRLVAIDPTDTEGGNVPALGPAGTVHMPLRDWLRFAQDQLDGVHGRGKLLQAAGYSALHTPVTENYALGWGVLAGADGKPQLLTHSGSNGHWLADIRIMPKHDMIFLVVMNAGNDAASQALVDVGKALKERLKPFD